MRTVTSPVGGDRDGILPHLGGNLPVVAAEIFEGANRNSDKHRFFAIFRVHIVT